MDTKSTTRETIHVIVRIVIKILEDLHLIKLWNLNLRDSYYTAKTSYPETKIFDQLKIDFPDYIITQNNWDILINPKTNRKLEIDKTGLGDSFAGGFLAGMILNKSYSECAVLGNIMSSKVIQLKGFQVPKLNVEDIKKELEQEYSNEKNNYLSSDL